MLVIYKIMIPIIRRAFETFIVTVLTFMVEIFVIPRSVSQLLELSNMSQQLI